MERPRESTLAWGALIGGIILWDATCPTGETLSEGFDNLMQSRLGRLAAFASVFATGAHLLNIYERFGVQNIDPIHQSVRFLKGVDKS